MNEQPWIFIVATKTSKSDFERPLVVCWNSMSNVRSTHRCFCCRLRSWRFDSTGELNRHAFHDVGQAIANLTFQATVSGLVVHQIVGFDVEKARREFSTPQDYEPVAAAESFLGKICSTTAMKELLQWDRSRRTDTVYTIWRATSGNGLAIGLCLTTPTK
jgi:hypothetical protein